MKVLTYIVVEEPHCAVIVRTSMHDVDFWMVGWGCACWMDVQTAEVPDEIDCVADWDVGEVLVAEYDYFFLRYEERELVFSCLVQLA